jgi:hypothetical protein
MKRLACASAILVLTATLGLAQGHDAHQGAGHKHANGNPDHKTYEGYVLDKHCATGDDLAEKAKSHPKSCLLKRQCARSGYGLVIDGKWYAFDRKGSAHAARLLRTAYIDEHEKWEVKGSRENDVIHIASVEVSYAFP